MKKGYTHVSIILDRSGSMGSIRDDTVGGFNAFLDAQKEETGKATLTLVQFDTQDSYEVIYDFKPINEIPPLSRDKFIPRAGTPLLDALGRGINDIEGRIADMPEDERPSKILVAVVTDGQENSSHEFSKGQITKMINERTEKGEWEFIFLSAGLNSITDAVSYGIAPDLSADYSKDSTGTSKLWNDLTETVKLGRHTHTMNLKINKNNDDKDGK